MKALTLTAAISFALGVAIALVAGLTWPEYDAAQAYLSAARAAEYAGADAPTATDYIAAPANFYLGHTLAITIGGALASLGALGGLLTLHARAIREALRA